MKPEDVIAGKGRPFTGQEYMESLRDEREVYIYGERVADVTTHPAFRNSVRSIAKLYDALHDPKHKDVLTCPTDGGNGGFTHKFFRVGRSREDLIAQREAIAAWARMSYGWMGRTPDYKASLMNTLGVQYDFYEKFADNAKAWYRRAQDNVLFMNHAIVNPPVDRNKAPEQARDVFITIQKETDGGCYVSGAKVVATSSAITHYNFLGQNAAMPVNDPDLAIMFIAPMNAPGVKLFCRTSYEMAASVMGTPYDYPLSSRFDENDAIFVFDNVFIPWENILIYREVEKLKTFYPRSGFVNGFQFQGCTRLAVKLDFIVGIVAKALARHRRGRISRQSGDARRDHRVAKPVLGDLGCDGDESGAVERRRGAAECAVRIELPRFRRRRLPALQGDRREDHRVRADLPAVIGKRLRESRHRQIPGKIRARLEQHRLPRAHQDHEAVVGCDRHRVRRQA